MVIDKMSIGQFKMLVYNIGVLRSILHKDARACTMVIGCASARLPEPCDCDGVRDILEMLPI